MPAPEWVKHMCVDCMAAGSVSDPVPTNSGSHLGSIYKKSRSVIMFRVKPPRCTGIAASSCVVVGGVTACVCVCVCVCVCATAALAGIFTSNAHLLQRMQSLLVLFPLF